MISLDPIPSTGDSSEVEFPLTHGISPQTFAGQDEWMEELLGDEYYVELFAEIADSEPITEAIDEVCTRMLCSLRCVTPVLLLASMRRAVAVPR